MTVTALHPTYPSIDRAFGDASPDAIPMGTVAHPHQPYTGKTRIGLGPELAECVRQHTHAHLYDDSTLMARDMVVYHVRNNPQDHDTLMVDVLLDAHDALATKLDLYGWDCDTCRRAVFTDTLTAPCPHCGGK